MNRILRIISFSIAIAVVDQGFSQTNEQRPNPQIIFLTDKAQKCPWSQGMTLMQGLNKFGGTSASNVFLIRRGSIEKLKVLDNLKRSLEPWDILVVGSQPAAQ